MMGMRRLLDISSQRLIKILELFALGEQNLTFKDIARHVKASVRTVHDDIARIKERWGDKLSIEVSPKSGISVKGCSIFTFEKICKEIFNESQSLLLFQGIFFNPYRNNEFHEAIVFASHSTLSRMIKKFNGKRVDDTGIRILKNKAGYYLYAPDEQQFRRLCTCFTLEIEGLDKSLFEQWLKEYQISFADDYINEIIRRINPNIDEFYDDRAFKYDATFFLVSLIRELQGFHAEPYPIDYEPEITEELLRLVRKKFPAVTKNALNAICIGLKLHHTDIRKDRDWHKIRPCFDTFLNNALKIIGVPAEENWLEEAYTVLGKLYNLGLWFNIKASTLFDRVEYFAQLFKRKNRAVYDYLYRETEIMSAKLGVNLTFNFHKILFWLCVRIPDFSGVTIKKKLLVIGDYSELHTEFLANFIEENINGAKSRKVETIPFYLGKGEPLPPPESFDIIASTMPNIASVYPELSSKGMAVVNDYPTEENIADLKNLLSGLKMQLD